MKLVSILFLLIFISCEENPSTGSEDGSRVESSTIEIVDISPDFYGEYLSECSADSSLEFGQGKIYTLSLSSGAPSLTITEYGEANCQTLLATRSYSLGFKVESHISIIENETRNKLEIEYIESNLMLNHSAFDGYWDCGFTASLDTLYPLNSVCQSNLNGDVEKYDIQDTGDDQYKLIGPSETITLTKQ